MSNLKCVVVTPERTELDVLAESITVPLFDGEMGILKGHSPVVGRLGLGLLRIKNGGTSQSYFVEGGFVQIANNVVSILTDKIINASQLTSAIASQAMHDALALPTGQPEFRAARDKAIERARALERVTA